MTSPQSILPKRQKPVTGQQLWLKRQRENWHEMLRRELKAKGLVR